MKIDINPLEQYVKRAERRINAHMVVTAQDLAHAHKRRMADYVNEGVFIDSDFAAAAKIEGMTPQELATLILAKPDTMMAAENRRRSFIVRIRQATTPKEIEAILAESGAPPHYDDVQVMGSPDHIGHRRIIPGSLL